MSFAIEGCVNCGAEDRELHTLPTHVGTLQACAPCISKFGLKTLADEADRILAAYKYEVLGPTCFCCREPVMLNIDGTAPTLCRSCIQRGREVVRRANARC